MARSSFAAVVAASLLLCVPLVGSEDLYWRPNTDWSNPSNWKLGRTPCEGDVADFSTVPQGSVIKLDSNATVRSMVLPLGSTIKLGKSLTLRFSNKSSCKIETPNGPMVAPVEDNNVFVGAGPKLWEMANNWESKDGVAAKSSPCGKDRAFFREDHYYWTVESNLSKVFVQSLIVRGERIFTNQIPKLAPEFKLDLTVEPGCADDPSRCPCLSNVSPSSAPLPPSPAPARKRSNSDDNSTTVAVVVVVVLVVLLVLVGLTVLLIVLWLRWKRSNYKKDDPLGEPDDSLHSPTARAVSAEDGVLFDNPIYETSGGGGYGGYDGGGDVKKEKISPDKNATKAHEMVAILKPSTDHYEPVDFPITEKEKKTPLPDDYEQA